MLFPSLQYPRQLIENLLQKRFSQPPTLWTQTGSSARKEADRGNRALWIISRGLTRHQVFSVPEALPDGKRRAALEFQVQKAFPFRSPAFTAVWKGAEASVYAWDEDAVRAAQTVAGVAPNSQVVPETLIRAQGLNGIRLVVNLDGFEGQFWVDGFLKASRWWSTTPSALDWTKFVRSLGVGLTAADMAPAPLTLPLLERPWTEGTFSFDDWTMILRSRRAITIAATAAVCPFIFFGTAAAVVSAIETSVRAELATLDKENQAIRKDRAAAYANLEAIENFISLDEYPPQAEVLALAVQRLAETGAPKILSWSFDRGNLEITARAKQDLDPTAYITLFERDPMFENVSGTLVGQDRDLQLRMIVTKRAIN